MKKKISLALTILFIMVSILSGCSGSKSTASNADTSKQTITVTPTVEPTSAPAPSPAVIQEQSSGSTTGGTVNSTSAATVPKSTVKKANTVSTSNSVSSGTKAVTKVKIEDAVKGASEYIKKASAKVNYKINDWDALALKASGYNIDSKEFKINNKGYIEYKSEGFTKDSSSYYLTDYARSYLGIISAGYDPSNFMGFDITNIIKNSTSRDGKFLDTVNGGEDLLNCHVWSMIALEAGKVSYDRASALKYIETHQNSDGGFYIFSAFPQSDVDFTAMTVIALTMAGRDKSSEPVADALGYLKKQTAMLSKNANGETAETLSVILQAVVAAKDDVSKYTINGKNLPEELLSFYNTDGSFRHVKSSIGNAISTRQALTALVSYKNNKNVYSDLTFKKGNFYNVNPQQQTAVKLHKALYNSVSGKVEISAAASDADSVVVDISDGNKSYSDKIVPKDNKVTIEKDLPASNYIVTLKTIKNNNVTSIIKDSIENVNKLGSATVRVESYDRTIVKSQLLTAGNNRVYDYDGNSFTTSVLSAYTFVMKALVDNNVLSSTNYGFGSPYIAGINSIFTGKFGGWDGWMYYINGKDPGVAMSDARVSDGDEILVYYGDWGARPLDISGPTAGGVNESLFIKITSDNNPVDGANVYVNDQKFITDANGIAFISIPAAGTYEVYADKNDEQGKPMFIRSKRLCIDIK